LLTCKQFLQEMSGYIEKTLDPQELAELHRHVSECPNCFVVCDTTEKTLRVFKGMECQPVPKGIQARLMAAIEKRMRDKGKGACCHGGAAHE
jgi:hypothetical protein